MADRIGQFCFLTYPESMGDIYDRISSKGIVCVRSPIHDRDWTTDGEIKKAHYHNMIIFSGLKSEKQVKEVCEYLGIAHYEIPFDKKGMLRYFCHLDENPDEKAIYSIEDVKCFGGFDYNSVLTAKDGKISEHTALLKWAREKGQFDTFRAFVDCVVEEMPNYLNCVVDKAYFYNSYFAFYNARDQNKR